MNRSSPGREEMAFRAETMDTWAGSDSGSIMDSQDKQEWVVTKAAEIVTGWYQVARSLLF